MFRKFIIILYFWFCYRNSVCSNSEDESDPLFEVREETPGILRESDIDNIVRDAKIPPKEIEVLLSRLKRKRILEKGVKVTGYRKRQKCSPFGECFSTDWRSEITYCNDIDQLFRRFQHEHVPLEWRLFIKNNEGFIDFGALQKV